MSKKIYITENPKIRFSIERADPYWDHKDTAMFIHVEQKIFGLWHKTPDISRRFLYDEEKDSFIERRGNVHVQVGIDVKKICACMYQELIFEHENEKSRKSRLDSIWDAIPNKQFISIARE